MRKSNRKVLGSIAIFFMLLTYFVCSYKYYPGMQLQIEGETEVDLQGRVYWDYGYGFNPLDSIDAELSAEGRVHTSPFGRITIEPAGFKEKNSRGYLAWLVIPEDSMQLRDFTIEGKHHWGRWLQIDNGKKGRQLALFPGAKLTTQSEQADVKFYFFKAPQAGYIKIVSEGGPVRFYNGYGKNLKWKVSRYNYRNEASGKIKYIFDPYNNRKNSTLSLPQQKIEKVYFDFNTDIVKSIQHFSHVRIAPTMLQPGGTPQQIILEELYINGQKIPLTDANITIQGERQDDKYILVGHEDFIEFEGDISSYELVFASESIIYNLSIIHDGQPAETVLVKERKESLRISNTAPLDRINARISSCEIIDYLGNTHVFYNRDLGNKNMMEIRLSDISQSKINFLLIVVQFMLAFSIASVAYIALTAVGKANYTSRELFKNIFWKKKRWFFWSIFLCGVIVNFLYLAADWPGSMTPDSVFMHKELKQLQFTNHHPYSYSLLLLVLHQFYDAPVIVAIFQIFAFHGLCAYAFYLLHIRGVKLYILLPAYFLIPLSIPANLLNITIWKDIPYSILVLFWALVLTNLFYLRVYEKRLVKPGWLTIFVLAMLFLLLCTLRHNGIVYVPFIPIILYLICRPSTGWVLKFSAISAVLLLVYFFVLPEYVLNKKPKLNNYAKKEASKYVGELASVSGAESGEENYLEYYIAKRTRKFVATLGTSGKASTWYNDMHAPPQRWFSVDEARAEMVSSPLNKELSKIFNKILQTRNYTGLFSGRFVFWNSLFSLVALVIVAMLYKWLPLSALYSSFFLYQGFFMYFVVWERWRYLYFIYLGGLMLLPIVAMEITRRRSSGKSTEYVSSTVVQRDQYPVSIRSEIAQ